MGLQDGLSLASQMLARTARLGPPCWPAYLLGLLTGPTCQHGLLLLLRLRDALASASKRPAVSAPRLARGDAAAASSAPSPSSPAKLSRDSASLAGEAASLPLRLRLTLLCAGLTTSAVESPGSCAGAGAGSPRTVEWEARPSLGMDDRRCRFAETCARGLVSGRIALISRTGSDVQERGLLFR